MGQERLEDQAGRLAMVLLRYSKLLDQNRLAEAIHITRSQSSEYERGRSAVPSEILERVAAVTDFPEPLLGLLLRGIRSFLIAGKGRSRADRALSEGLVVEVLALIREAIDLTTSPRRGKRSEGRHTSDRPLTEERIEAEPLLAFLRERCTPADAQLLFEEAEEYRSWPVCQQAALLSVARAPNHPREALKWAELAVRIAEQVPGEEAWRWRLQGWALHFLSNAKLACNDLPAARQFLARGQTLWELGAPSDGGLLGEAWLLWIEAALLRAQRRFAEALPKIDAALGLDRGELRGRILLSKSNLRAALGDAEGSTAVLLEAEFLIDTERDPRLALILRFNLLVDLCDLGRIAEARTRLAAVREIAERLGEALDLTRCDWLRGKIEAGLGNHVEALAAFGQVRRDFRRLDLAYDYALVSLDLSLLHLARGQTAEVSATAREMLWIFQAQGVHREALAALRIFCAAAEQETATAELVRKVERYLRRAQVDPMLRFDR